MNLAKPLLMNCKYKRRNAVLTTELNKENYSKFNNEV